MSFILLNLGMRDVFENIDSLIAEIQIDLAFPADKMRPQLLRWIYRTVEEIGVGYGQLTSCKQAIKNNQAKKPKNYLALDRMYLGDKCIEPVYKNIITCCDRTRVCNDRYLVEEQEGVFVFNSAVANEFDEVEIIHASLPLDNNGMPLVPKAAVNAIKLNVEYNYAMYIRNKRRTNASRQNPVAYGEIQDLRYEARRSIAAARGRLNGPIGVGELMQVGERFVFRRGDYPVHRSSYTAYI